MTAAGANPAAERIVANVSDTARWVAVYRAMENERADALFRDPFASRLAGRRGYDIAAAMPKAMRRNVWPMVMRTKAVDDLVLASVAAGTDRVLNLAAGLDARPYRLPLPESLTWVEVDLPAILADKEGALAGETPRCRLARVAADLSDPGARAAAFDRALDGARRALVITEGLLIYLPDRHVRELAMDLSARPAVQSWLTDLVSPAVLRMLLRQVNARMPPDALMQFAPANGVAFFEPLGWSATVVRSLLLEASRHRRLPLLLRPFALLPEPDPRSPGRRPWSCVTRLDRSPRP